jgi:hypothetical protein
VWDAFVAKVAFHHFADDFSDGTADGDPDWQEVSGDWGVTSTVAFAASATRRNVGLVQGVAALDAFGTGTIEARIRMPRTSARTPNGSIVFHYRDAANYRYVTLQKTFTGGKLIIGQVGDPAGDGSPGFRRSRAVTLKGRFQRMKVVLYPNGLLRVYRAGVLLREHPCSHVAPGRVGLAAVKSRTLFDDVVIR